MKIELKLARIEIDSLDEEIVKLIGKRMKLSDRMINEKLKEGLSIFDKTREDEIIKRLVKLFPEIDSSLINEIYSSISHYTKKEHYKSSTRPKEYFESLTKDKMIIAGPCAVESKEQIFGITKALSGMGIKILRGNAFKPRTSPDSFQGLGEKGIYYVREAADRYNMILMNEILDEYNLEKYYEMIDIVQVGSRNMSSYGFLKIIGRKTSEDHKPVLLKRGFSSTISEFLNAAEYIRQAGNPNIILCLRGIRTFEQSDSSFRFTPDLGSIIELKEKTGLPVIFDPSHTAGQSKYISTLAKAAISIGADGLMIETHNNPSEALVDGEQAITPDELEALLKSLKEC